MNLKSIICFFTDHDWVEQGVGLPESASPGIPYSLCRFCGEDSRETWEIEDDTRCREERLILQSQKGGVDGGRI